MFAEDHRLHLRRRHLQTLGEMAAEASRVQLRAESQDALPRQTGSLHCQISEHVHRVADDDEIASFFRPAVLTCSSSVMKEIDVAVNEVSRLSSGLRRSPAVMTTTSLVATSAIVPAVMFWSRRQSRAVQQVEA